MLKAFKSRQFLSFLLAGGFAAVINFGSRFFYNNYMPFGSAVILAYLTGMITAFVLSKLFVFDRSVHSTSREFIYFGLVNILAVIQTYMISIGLAHYLFPLLEFSTYPEAVAHAFGVVFPVFTSYFGHKYFTFKERK